MSDQASKPTESFSSAKQSESKEAGQRAETEVVRFKSNIREQTARTASQKEFMARNIQKEAGRGSPGKAMERSADANDLLQDAADLHQQLGDVQAADADAKEAKVMQENNERQNTHPRGLQSEPSSIASQTPVQGGDVAETDSASQVEPLAPQQEKSARPSNIENPKDTSLLSMPGDAVRKAGRRDVTKKHVQANEEALSAKQDRKKDKSQRRDVSDKRRSSDPSKKKADQLSYDERLERYERRRYPKPEGGIGYAFNETHPMDGETDRWLAARTEAERNALADPRATVILHVMASRPGTEQYNQDLTDQRGGTLKKELEELGVRAQIQIVALGESEARKPYQSPTRERPISDKDKADRKDNAFYRKALIEIQPYVVELEAEKVRAEKQFLPERWSSFEADRREGKNIFKEKIDPLGEKVRAKFPLPPNPFGEDPSSDPGKLGKQISEKIKEPVKEVVKGLLKGDPFAPEKAVAKMLGKYTIGALYEATVRNQQREEVEKQRERGYDALAAGVASGLDPQFEDAFTPKDDLQRQIYDSAQKTVQNLSKLESHQLAIYLAERARRIDLSQFEIEKPSYEEHLRHQDGSSYARAVNDIFDDDNHFNTD